MREVKEAKVGERAGQGRTGHKAIYKAGMHYYPRNALGIYAVCDAVEHVAPACKEAVHAPTPQPRLDLLSIPRRDLWVGCGRVCRVGKGPVATGHHPAPRAPCCAIARVQLRPKPSRPITSSARSP